MTTTARAKFAEELKARRERAGLTQVQLAQNANISRSLLRKVEQGDRRPTRHFALGCDKFFNCPGTFTRFQELTLREDFPDWFAERIQHEEEAVAITEWEMRAIPGLLQTRAYTRAIMQTGRPFVPEAELRRDFEGRMERQEIFTRSEPPKLWEIIAEGTLRQLVGGVSVMQGQLDHLMKLTDAAKCVVQVLPLSAVEVPGIDGPLSLFEFRDRQPVAYLEGWRTGWLVEDSRQVTEISTCLSMIKSCALTPTESRNLMIDIRDGL